MAGLKDFFNTIVGSNTDTSTSVTTTETPNANIGLIIGGIVLAVIVIGGAYFLFKK